MQIDFNVRSQKPQKMSVTDYDKKIKRSPGIYYMKIIMKKIKFCTKDSTEIK